MIAREVRFWHSLVVGQVRVQRLPEVRFGHRVHQHSQNGPGFAVWYVIEHGADLGRGVYRPRDRMRGFLIVFQSLLVYFMHEYVLQPPVRFYLRTRFGPVNTTYVCVQRLTRSRSRVPSDTEAKFRHVSVRVLMHDQRKPHVINGVSDLKISISFELSVAQQMKLNTHNLRVLTACRLKTTIVTIDFFFFFLLYRK